MKTYTRYTVTAAAALALAMPFAAPVSANPAATATNSQEIVVKSRAAMEEWQAETTKDLNRALARVPLARKVLPNNAVVQVAFTLGEDGKPDNIEVLRGTGNWAARKTAELAVRHLDNIASVPVANPQDANFIANVIFASTPRKRDELAAALWESEARRIAASDPDRNTIVLGG